MTAKKNNNYAFTIAEMLVALAVMALLLTAVAIAFNASATNYNENNDMFKALNAGRQAMLRMTAQLRTAEQVPLASVETNPTIQCSFTPADTNQVSRFRYDSASKSLYLDSAGSSYLLCNQITAMTFSRSPSTGKVKSVQMSMTVTIGNRNETIASAVVLRKALL